MKVVLIRHIKSDWSSGKPDFERAIREDRRLDAHTISNALKAIQIKPKRILSSPAKRTRQTAKLFANAFDFPMQDIEYIDDIYEATSNELLDVVKKNTIGEDCTFVICHNPAITEFVNAYTNARIDNVPTCGCAVLALIDGRLLLEGFYYPKQFC